MNGCITDHIAQVLGYRTQTCGNHHNCTGDFFCINSDGSIYPCQRYWPEEFKSYGNIYDFTSYEEIYETDRFKEWKTITDDLRKSCIEKECRWVDICASDCNHNNYMYNQSMTEVCPWNCKMKQGTYDHIFKILQTIDHYKDHEKYNPSFLRILLDLDFISPMLVKEIRSGRAHT